MLRRPAAVLEFQDRLVDVNHLAKLNKIRQQFVLKDQVPEVQ